MTNGTRVGMGGNEEPNDEYLSQVSTLESLIIQALINQISDIVANQGRAKRISYENQLIQVQTLQGLAQVVLMLTDAESIFLHGGKLQDFFNRVFLEHSLGAKSHERSKPPAIEHEPGTCDEGSGT